MRRKFLDVEYSQSSRSEDLLDSEVREIREVLVIDGVKLPAINHFQQMRKLDRYHALRFQYDLQASHKVIQVRNVRENIIGQEQVRLIALLNEFPRTCFSKEFDNGWDATLSCGFSSVCSGLYAQNRNVL